jgi:hypothetical protein
LGYSIWNVNGKERSLGGNSTAGRSSMEPAVASKKEQAKRKLRGETATRP